MKHLGSRIFLIFLAIFVAAAISANAQDTRPPDTAKQQAVVPPEQTRDDVLSELGLSPDQVQQLRRMNAERKPIVEAANKRFREANRALDQVIYGDAVDEGEFRMRLKEFQEAQAEVVRIRFENELALRRVLTPDQLVKFRGIRQRIAEERRVRNAELKAIRRQNRPLQNLRPMRQMNPNRPPRKLP